MKKLFLTSLVAISFSASLQSLQAQTVPVKQWDKTFGGSDGDDLMSLQQTTDGGYILGGISRSPISGDKSQACQGTWDYWVVKLNANGNKIWDKTFGGSDTDELLSLQQTSDGGYILGGNSNSSISGDKSQGNQGKGDFWIVKLDSIGNKSWDKTFGGIEFDKFSSLQQTSDGGYILGGHSLSYISGDKSQASNGVNDYWMIKLDANGNKIWDKSFGGNSFDILFSLRQTSDGGYILGGHSWSGISGDKSQVNKGLYDFWVVKTDASGNKIWDKTFGGNNDDYLFSLMQTIDGGYILGGRSKSGISGDKSQACQGGHDFWVVKLDSNGNKSWDKTFGGRDEEWFYALQQTSDGGYVLGGVSRSGISGDKSQASQYEDYWVVKLTANGNKTWDKTLGGNGTDWLYSLQQTSDGGYILGGGSDSNISTDKSEASKGSVDFWIVKLSASFTGVKNAEVVSPISIYPNPSKGRFYLKLSNLFVPAIEVTVFDMLGRVVTQQEIQVSSQQVAKELTMPSVKGIYLLQIKVGEQIVSQKVVVE